LRSSLYDRVPVVEESLNHGVPVVEGGRSTTGVPVGPRSLNDRVPVVEGGRSTTAFR